MAKGGTCMAKGGSMHGEGGACMVCTSHSMRYGQSMRGRYASYWNAFLFLSRSIFASNATAGDGAHPTGMYSCKMYISDLFRVALLVLFAHKAARKWYLLNVIISFIDHTKIIKSSTEHLQRKFGI